MNWNINWLDKHPPEKRLALFLDEALDGEDHDERIRQLATELGYTNAKTIRMWTTGTAKVPLRMVMPLAQSIGTDVSNLLPLWLSQEMGSTDADRLYMASKRFVDFWEFSIIAVAREVYLRDEDDGLEDDGGDDEDST